MKILFNGIDYSTGKLLVPGTDEQTLAESVLKALPSQGDKVRSSRNLTSAGAASKKAIREEAKRKKLDIGDPKSVGWTFLINKYDPQHDEIVAAIRPLAKDRGMENPAEPLRVYEDNPECQDWVLHNYYSLDAKKPPEYILIVGGPDRVSFHFQSSLDAFASVGRVAFDSMDDLKTYVDKVIHLETADSPTTERACVFAATDHGGSDATVYSHEYMAKPLAELVETEHGLSVHRLMGDEATKENLLKRLHNTKPALVYTASHGAGAPGRALDLQRQINGAIVCQDEQYLTAEDIPLDQPFLEGAIFYQFACFGYGTPAESDIYHWYPELPLPQRLAPEAFVAALPKKLLAHPRGPIGFVGHVDVALVHGFIDPKDPEQPNRWDARIQPFRSFVDLLLDLQPMGIAMEAMGERLNLAERYIADASDRIKHGSLKDAPDVQAQLVDAFMFRNDAQNYLMFGDPAVRVRLPAAS